MSGCYPTNLDKDDDVSPLVKQIQELHMKFSELHERMKRVENNYQELENNDDRDEYRKAMNIAINNYHLLHAENTKLRKQVDALLDQAKNHKCSITIVSSGGGKAGGFPCASSSDGGGVGGSHYTIKCCKHHPHTGKCL